MYRYLFRFVVTTITILTANLLTTSISDHMVSFRSSYKPVAFTFIGIVVIILVFYPLFMKLEDWVKTISVRLFRSGKSFAGKYVGIILTFIGSILILFYFYARMWYHIDFVKILLQGDIGNYM